LSDAAGFWAKQGKQVHNTIVEQMNFANGLCINRLPLFLSLTLQVSSFFYQVSV